MATKKSFYVLLSLFFITAELLGYVNGVNAETLKLQISTVVTKVEQFPIENIEGTVLASLVKDGVFVLENGELGTFKFVGTTCNTVGKGGSFLGYTLYIFGDGSTIVGTFQPGTSWGDPEKKVAGIQKASGELIMGSGRFKGIKGTLTMTGKLLKPLKGELGSKSHNEIILTYSLSP